MTSGLHEGEVGRDAGEAEEALGGRSDDGQMALVVTLTGNAEREGAEMFKLDVATVVEVAGGDVGDGLDDALQVGRTERAGLADIGRHLVEADGTRLDGNGVKTGSNVLNISIPTCP